MKKLLLSLSVATVGCMSQFNAYAQLDAAAFIQGGKEDANLLLNSYASPLLKSFGVGLNGGWFNTAKPHGIGGFDLTISVNLPFAPVADQSFNAATLPLKNLSFNSGSTTTNAPTIFGSSDDKATPLMNIMARNPLWQAYENNNPGSGTNPFNRDTALSTFQLPPGAGINFFPVPTAQFAIGVGFGTEVAIRYAPPVNAGGIKTGLFGFAIKHDFKQWIPGIKDMPFDLSAMFGYTNTNAEVAFTGDNALKPSAAADVYNPNPGKTYDDQKLTLDATGWTLNVLLSKKLGPITPYLGLGFQSSTTEFMLAGTYPVTLLNDNYNPAAAPGSEQSYFKRVMELKDPITITGSVASPRATLGLRLKLLLLTIHGDYTFATYNMATIGVGLNLQSIVPFKL